MSSSLLLPRSLIVFGCALALAIVGVAVQALQLTSTPQQFRSLAKLVAGGQLVLNDSAQWREQQEDFYGTIIETLESAEMKRRALERVRALNPDVKDHDVDIRVARTKGSAIFNILATGDEPKYTRLFLDALIDEFISFRQSIRESAQGRTLQQFLQEVVTRQKKMEDSTAALEKARAKADTLSAKSDMERLVTRLTNLRNRRDDLRLELKSLDPQDAARQSLEAKLGPLEQEIRSIESELDRHEAGLAELRTLTERQARDRQLYEKLFEQVERIQALFNTSADYVAVQERATPAAENVEDWRLPMIAAAGGGCLLGGIAGLVLAFVLVRPRPPQPSQPPQIPAAA